MKIKDPRILRQMYAEKKKWLTIEEISSGLNMSTRTLCKAFSGKQVRPATARRLADPLEIDVTQIATFIQ